MCRSESPIPQSSLIFDIPILSFKVRSATLWKNLIPTIKVSISVFWSQTNALVWSGKRLNRKSRPKTSLFLDCAVAWAMGLQIVLMCHNSLMYTRDHRLLKPERPHHPNTVEILPYQHQTGQSQDVSCTLMNIKNKRAQGARLSVWATFIVLDLMSKREKHFPSV